MHPLDMRMGRCYRRSTPCSRDRLPQSDLTLIRKANMSSFPFLQRLFLDDINEADISVSSESAE